MATDRLAGLRVVDPVLTELSIGYSNAELVGAYLFPFAYMLKEGGKIPKFTKESFKIYSTERALRAKSNRISPDDRNSIDVVLEEHDLEYPIDYREGEEDLFDLQSHATEVVTEGIALRREKKCADIAQNPANYAPDSKITLSGTSQFTSPTSDPIGVVENGKEVIRSKIGRRPNTMLMGAATFKVLKNHPALLDRVKFSMKGIVTIDMMKEIFGIENIVVGEPVYANDLEQFSDVWGDNIILAYVKPMAASAAGQAKRNYRDPSYGYTLRKKGQPMVDTYTEGGKLELVRNTDIFKVVLVGADAGYLISDTNA